MESIIDFVTASIASGISAAITRKPRLDPTMAGAESQTIRSTGGKFLSPLTRSRQLGCNPFLIFSEPSWPDRWFDGPLGGSPCFE